MKIQTLTPKWTNFLYIVYLTTFLVQLNMHKKCSFAHIRLHLFQQRFNLRVWSCSTIVIFKQCSEWNIPWLGFKTKSLIIIVGWIKDICKNDSNNQRVKYLKVEWIVEHYLNTVFAFFSRTCMHFFATSKLSG